MIMECRGRRLGRFALLSLTVVVGACSVRAADPDPAETEDMLPGGRVITREDIARTGAHNAWEAIERANTHLVIDHARAGTPSRVSYRGADSLLSSREILLVVDGNTVKNVEEELRAITAESILYIQILTGREAVLRWGSESGNGVIVVRTSAR